MKASECQNDTWTLLRANVWTFAAPKDDITLRYEVAAFTLKTEPEKEA